MMTRRALWTLFLKYWDRVRSSFWFIPSVMVIGAVVLAVAMVALDETVTDKNLDSWWWAYTGSADGANAVLGTIAGSMITIAGTVFSLTLVALTLASSQFGPRLLRNFMRDPTNQIVMGTFIATFLYCLLVLRTVRRDEIEPFVPHLSVTLGVVFALASVGVLIHFIHHVAVSIQADEVIARVFGELMEGIDRLYPETFGKDPSQQDAPAVEPSAPSSLPESFESESRTVPAPEDGYLERVDGEALLSMAIREDVILRIERRPGHYVIAGTPLVRVWPGEKLTDDLAQEIRFAFVQGSQRTPTQDLGFPIDQLVEIAARALSPGVNDPFTAMTCVDRLGSGLARLAQRKMPSAFRLDDDGRLRVVARPQTFPSLVRSAFDPIRQHAASAAAVLRRLKETIAAVIPFTHGHEDRHELQRQMSLLASDPDANP